MKRSDMVEELSVWVDMIRYDDSINNSVNASLNPSREYAEMLLNKLEKLGMKPPIRKRCPVLLTDEFVWEKE